MNLTIENNSEFQKRHIGLNESEQQEMLKTLGFDKDSDLIHKVIPSDILSSASFSDLGPGQSEYETLRQLKSLFAKNQIYTTLIGQGFYNTITPTVIQRNILENPVWYTAYTPYQAEISQGRLESLLNFQTMVSDLTGLEIANSSLLDEGSAAAEAMAMAHALCKHSEFKNFVVANDVHPHTLAVLKTRMEPLGLTLQLVNPEELKQNVFPQTFAIFLQYPNTYGDLIDYKTLAEKYKAHGALVIVASDLMALTLLTPPGEWGADIVVGNSQRFGVPMGFGGPHAAFLATKKTYQRLMPGRLIGVSVDSQGNRALRLALQTREQHIRREKATSNICTAQVLLANMAAMYAVYHGPEGLKNIAQKIHGLTRVLAEQLQAKGFALLNKFYFDTLTVQTKDANRIYQKGLEAKINFRQIDHQTLGLSLDETTDLKVVHTVLSCFDIHSIHLTELQKSLSDKTNATPHWPKELVRSSSYLTHPVFNSHQTETELLRYIHHLQSKDITLTHSMIPLGSCTMKLNATTELVPVSWPEVNQIHPYAPLNQVQGYMELIQDLEKKLCTITGFAAVSLQPNAGSQGEYAGLLVIRKYFLSRNEGHRNICLIPSSAHGTNPASAVMAGLQVVVIQCDDKGNIDIEDLKTQATKHKDRLAALMVTYPSTHGVFEEGISEICQIVHQHGGQVYMDGANMNALVGLCRPGEFGPDVSHMNLHKTFAIPHGGGGPGVGPIGVAAHLKDFLPATQLDAKHQVGLVTSTYWGSASILPISWSYIQMMGAFGLRKASVVSILSANYIAKKLESDYPVLYKGKHGLVAHECIIDLRELKKTSAIDVTDVAKRLIDYGFHAPTMSWPVAGTLMIEPTESESLEEINRFIDAMKSIRQEIREIEKGLADKEDNVLKNSPHTVEMLLASDWKHSYSREKAAYPLNWLRKNKFWSSVGRVDNAFGDRNLVCSCPPLEDYTQEPEPAALDVSAKNKTSIKAQQHTAHH